MSYIAYEEILKASRLLSQYLRPTSLQSAPSVSKAAGVTVTLKMETELPTGSFKIRGALYALAKKFEKGRLSHVVTASTGNHGAAVAYAARLLGARCTVYLPEHANSTKRNRIVEHGATVVECGRDLTEAASLGRGYAKAQSAYFLDDATDPYLPAGPATIALEILEQQADTDVIVVPVGDTALIRGVASAVHYLSPRTHVFGVQSANVPAYHDFWRARGAVPSERSATIADGLASQALIPSNAQQILDLVGDFSLVSDGELLGAMRHLILEERVLSEPAGAAATAALIHRRFRELGASVCALVTGANICPEVLRKV